MSSAVTYWRLPEEEADLLAYLKQDPTLIASPNRVVESAKQLVWSPLGDALEEPDAGFLIALPKFVPDMKVHRVSTGGVCIDITSAPALLYRRGRVVEKNRLMPTTLTINTSYVADDNRTVVDLSAEHVRWGSASCSGRVARRQIRSASRTFASPRKRRQLARRAWR